LAEEGNSAALCPIVSAVSSTLVAWNYQFQRCPESCPAWSAATADIACPVVLYAPPIRGVSAAKHLPT
jgi:hypothetical protein